MEANQKVICKKYYPGIEMGLDTQFQIFLTGKTYKIINKIWHQNQYYYLIENESVKIDPFNEDEFKEYFHSLAKMRKDKLLKLKKLFKIHE